MKALLAIALVAGASFACGRDVRVTLHLIETTQTGMSAILDEDLPDAELFHRMRAMVNTGEAKVADTVLVRGQEGWPVVLESISEISHPTPRQAPEWPVSAEQGKQREKIRQGWKKVARFFPAFAEWEGSFETRSVGMMLSVSATALGGTADRWYLVLNQWSGTASVARARNLNGGIVEARYPVFDSTSAGSTLPPADGQWRMLAVMNGPPGAGKKTLVFVKVDLLK